uniref:Uncharacterized protein n=1 Tax=Caenorhabditis japonica TaxID=281687 RepID=A0A8R1DQE8_CAEJA
MLEEFKILLKRDPVFRSTEFFVHESQPNYYQPSSSTEQSVEPEEPVVIPENDMSIEKTVDVVADEYTYYVDKPRDRRSAMTASGSDAILDAVTTLGSGYADLLLSPPPISIASRDPGAHGFVGLARSLARLAGGFVARCPRWFWIRRDVVGRADVPRRVPCDWQDSCSCFWMDSCRASCSLVEDFCPVAELITSESMSCPVLVRPVRSSSINNEVRTTLVKGPMFIEEYAHNLPNEMIPIN